MHERRHNVAAPRLGYRAKVWGVVHQVHATSSHHPWLRSVEACSQLLNWGLGHIFSPSLAAKRRGMLTALELEFGRQTHARSTGGADSQAILGASSDIYTYTLQTLW
eukprot:12402550-Karenia_brevis.AAC.1